MPMPCRGYIYITRPLLEMVESDDELAAVLAHESAHITHVHAIKAMSGRLPSQCQHFSRGSHRRCGKQP